MLKVEKTDKGFTVEDSVSDEIVGPVFKDEVKAKRFADFLYDHFEEPFLGKRQGGSDLMHLAEWLVNNEVLVTAQDVMRFFGRPQRFSSCVAVLGFKEASDEERAHWLAYVDGKAKSPDYVPPVAVQATA